MATPSHVDLSVLWVPIMPETSKLGPEMEKAGQSATESFGKGSEKLGDKITESVSKSKDKIRDVFRRTGSDASDAMADSVNQGSKKVEDALGASGTRAGGRFRDTISDAINNHLPQELSKSGGKLDTIADGLGHSIGGKLGEALNGGFSKIDEYAQKIGVDLSGWTGPIKDAAGPLDDIRGHATDIKGRIHEWVSDIEGLPGKLGKVGSSIGELAGPISVVAAAWAAAWKIRPPDSGPDWNRGPDGQVDPWKLAAGPVGTWLEKRYNSFFHGDSPDKPQSKPGYDGMLLGDHPGGDQASANFQPGGDPARWGGTIGSSQDAYDFFSSGASLPSPGLSKSGGWFGGKGRGLPSSNDSSDDYPTPLKPRNVGSNQGLTATSKSVKQVISTLFPQITDIGGWRPPDGYNEHSSGQALDVMIPGWNTPQGKALGDQISQYVLGHAKELGVDYTIWQHGQHNPDGSFQMYGDRGSPTQNHMDHVHIHTVKGGGSADSSSDLLARGSGRGSTAVAIPKGSQRDPLYVTQVDENGQTQKSDTQDLSQQFGSGLLDGIGQSLGLDGSVFKGFGGASNPKDFGIMKLGMGLLNNLLPHNGVSPGEAVSKGVVPVGPGGAQNVRPDPGDTYNFHGPVNTGMSVTQNGVQSPTGSLNDMNNSSRTSTATLPNAGTLPSS